MSGRSINGTSSYFPERCISTEGPVNLYGLIDPQWVKQTPGINERRITHPSKLTSGLTVKAARAALIDAGCSPLEVDLLIMATATPDHAAPSTASIVTEKLEMTPLNAFDLAAVCSGCCH